MIKYALIAAMLAVSPMALAAEEVHHSESFDASHSDANGTVATHDAVEQHSSADTITGSDDIPTGAVKTDEVHTTSTGRVVKDTSE